MQRYTQRNPGVACRYASIIKCRFEISDFGDVLGKSSSAGNTRDRPNKIFRMAFLRNEGQPTGYKATLECEQVPELCTASEFEFGSLEELAGDQPKTKASACSLAIHLFRFQRYRYRFIGVRQHSRNNHRMIIYNESDPRCDGRCDSFFDARDTKRPFYTVLYRFLPYLCFHESMRDCIDKDSEWHTWKRGFPF